jgi:nitrogen fixation protein NifU and related proteins
MEESLAQEVLLDHFKRPRHKGKLAEAALVKQGINPACGDRVALTGSLQDGRWVLKFEGAGCVISQASASMLTQALQGRTAEEAKTLALAVAKWVSNSGPPPDLSGEGLEDLEALSGVRRHQGRVKCAGLAWNLFLEEERASGVNR